MSGGDIRVVVNRVLYIVAVIITAIRETVAKVEAKLYKMFPAYDKIASKFWARIMFLSAIGVLTSTAGASNIISTIIVVAIMLIIGTILLGQFQSQAATQIAALNNSQVTAAYNNIVSSVWGAFNLMGIYPWVIGAVAILGAVVLLARR